MATREPLPRIRHAAVGIGSKLVVWGGDGKPAPKTTALEVFDVPSMEWEQPHVLHSCDMPDELYGMAVTSDGETAYCCGGATDSYTYHNTLFQVIPSQSLYREIKPTSPSRTAPGKSSDGRMVQYNDQLVLYGGINRWQRQFNMLHVFDLKKSECELWY